MKYSSRLPAEWNQTRQGRMLDFFRKGDRDYEEAIRAHIDYASLLDERIVTLLRQIGDDPDSEFFRTRESLIETLEKGADASLRTASLRPPRRYAESHAAFSEYLTRLEESYRAFARGLRDLDKDAFAEGKRLNDEARIHLHHGVALLLALKAS